MAEGGDNRSSDSIASEDLHDNVCYNCKEDGKHLEACGFCLDCGDHLCEECFQNHRKTKPTKHHRAMTLDQIRSENVAIVPKDTCTDICSKHTDEIIKYFCDLHDVFGCTVCMTVVHRNCEGVEYIPDVSEGLSESTNVTELISDLDTLVSKSENVIKESTENVSLAEATYNKATEAAEEYCKNIIARVKYLMQTTMEKAGALRDADTKRINAISRSAVTTLEKMKASRSELDTLRKNQQGCKLFVAMKNVNREMAAASQSIDEMMQNNTVETYTFHPCHDITSIMAATESDGLGSLSSLPLSLKQELEPNANHGNLYLSNEVASGGSKISDKTKATYVTDIPILSRSDSARTCNSGELVSLSANTLLVLDKSNEKIKQIDTQKRKVVGEISLGNNPTNLLKVSATQLAVVYIKEPEDGNKYIEMELFTVAGSDLILYRQFSLSLTCMDDFKYIAEQHCFIAIGSNSFQYISMSGRVSSPVQLGKIDGNWPEMMYEIDIDQQSLYVKKFDEYKNGVCTNASVRKVDMDGKVSRPDKLYCKDEYEYLIDQAFGLFILTVDSIYMTPGLSQEPSLLLSESDGIFRPCYVHHCPTSNQLYVGLEDCNFLKVFQLEKRKALADVVSEKRLSLIEFKSIKA